MSMRVPLRLVALAAAAALANAACDNTPGPGTVQPPGPKDFINFETIPTRALSLSPDGTRLFVTNVPDGRLEILRVTSQGLTPESSVQVGLEPIAVNARTNNEVWVVNHLSDSVSVVDVTPGQAPRVRRTILVGDEPRDVVFAGSGNSRAFVTAARRGQNHPGNTVDLTQVEGEPRADVWVFDANNLGTGLTANRLAIIPLFSDKPGSMGVSPDGRQVMVSVFTSGNGTTVASNAVICGTNGRLGRVSTQNSVQNVAPCNLSDINPSLTGSTPGGTVAPNSNYNDGVPNPRTGLILTNTQRSAVRANNRWEDAAGRNWSNIVPFTLPDNDVFAIDAGTLQVTRTYQEVGTLNFDVAVHPTDGRIFVATIDAINQNRFISVPSANLGPNLPAAGGLFRPNLPVTADPVTGKTLRGHLYESRIAILSGTSSQVIASRHLNKHINYEQFPVPQSVNDRSVANPQSLIFDRTGSTLFVGALGSNKIVPFSVAALSNDTFVPDASTHIQLGGRGGPSGLQMDVNNPNRMYVYKRFDNAVSVVDIAAKSEVSTVPFFNPEPPRITAGRPFFYDARVTSDNGEANCNVCHPSADKDDLAWDLGAPFLPRPAMNPNMFVSGIAIGIGGDNNPPMIPDPTKGPMTVLTLRGIKDSGPMFWRGDATSMTPFNERLNFTTNFPIVFDALNGKTGGISDAQFNMLTDWILSTVPPPNPHRALDQVLNQNQLIGQGVFTNTGQGAKGFTDVIFVCNTCHVLNEANGNFGAGGNQSTEGETQFFKVTQLRTTYDKVGMFGATLGFADPRPLGGARGNNVGPQVRGTGTLHDGSVAGAEEFLTNDVFQLTQAELRQVVDFTYAFPSNLAPIVGQQVTLGAGSDAATIARLDLLQQRAGTPYATPDSGPNECDLIGKGVLGGVQRGYLFQPAQNNFRTDTGGTISVAALRSQAQGAGQQITFTCVNPGAGVRLGLDRDRDGRLDGM